MNNLLNGMSENDRQILKSVAPLVVIILLFIFVGKFGVNQIKNIRTNIADTKKSQTILTEKLRILKSISADAGIGTNWTLFTLPKSNPSLQVISQLKLLSSMNSVIIGNIKSSLSSADAKGSSYITTTFKVSGSRESIVAFVKAIDTIAPITFVEKMELTESSGVNIANITSRTYWAPLPSTIPQVTQSVNDLTPSEKALLTQIGQLSFPIASDLTVGTSSGAFNENPFGQ